MARTVEGFIFKVFKEWMIVLCWLLLELMTTTTILRMMEGIYMRRHATEAVRNYLFWQIVNELKVAFRGDFLAPLGPF